MKASDGIKRPTGHWASLEERGVYLGLRFMLFTYRLLGRGGFSVLLFPVIAYFFLFDGAARRASSAFLARVHNDPRGQKTLGEKPGLRQSFRHFRCFGEAILDKLAAWAGDIPSQDLIYENLERFQEVERAGRGGVLIASHLGNMEVCRALGQQVLDLKINALVHTKHSANFNRLMREMNPDSAVSVIQVTEVGPETAIMLAEKVSKGEFIVIVGDRTPVEKSTRVTWAPFLGKLAPFPQGPFILAALLKCPVQMIFCIKRAGQYHVHFEPLAESIEMPRGNRNEVLELWITRYAGRLENYCLQNPYQWFNFFDFWNQAGTVVPDGAE